MHEDHQNLVEQYKKEYEQRGFSKKHFILEIFVVFLTCVMTMFQNDVSVRLNVIATIWISLLLFWYFSDFKQRLSRDRKIVNIAIKGLKVEQQNPLLNLSFFQNNISKFNILGEILKVIIFDYLFIYFFSVSFTQTLKSINPEIVKNLISTISLRTFFISIGLLFFYYRSFKPLMEAQRQLA